MLAAWRGRPRRDTGQGRAIFVLASALLLTAIAALLSWRVAEARHEAAVVAAVEADLARLDRRMTSSVALLRATRSFVLAEGDAITPRAFGLFVGGLRIRSDFPGIQGLAWSPRVGQGDTYRIELIEPMDERNRAALGYDMHSDPVRAAAMDRSRDSGRFSVTGSVVLKQEIDAHKSPGFLVYTPLYERGGVPQTLEERRRLLRGFVYAPFRAVDFFEGVFEPGVVRLHAVHTQSDGEPPQVLHGSEEALARPVATRRIDFGGQAWLLLYAPGTGRDWTDWVTPAGVLLAGLLVSVLLYQLTRTQVHARRRAELRSSQLGRQVQFSQLLVGIVSHDLRNPLNVIQLNAALLERAGLRDEFARCVQRIQSSTAMSLRLIRDLLDFTQARLGSGLPVVRTPGDIVEIVQQAADAARLAHPARRIEVDAHGDGAGTWDADRMAQVVGNLLNNALVYGDPDSPIHVSVHAEHSRVRIAVHNAGDPIPPALREALFEPLQQGESTAGRSGRNIGLGLYIVRQIARAHGGEVQCRSTRDEGTTFTVDLPRAEGAASV
nr:CHASE domain-containing protein [Ramlibacter algicola]